MVVEAWKTISEEMIAKSFTCCGQSKNGTPEEITCLKEGHPAHEAFAEVKQFWNYSAEEFDSEEIQEIEEVDEEQDPSVLDTDDDVDNL